jgi:hypothetical protein
MVMKPTDV